MDRRPPCALSRLHPRVDDGADRKCEEWSSRSRRKNRIIATEPDDFRATFAASGRYVLHMNSSPPISSAPFGIAFARSRIAQGSALAVAMLASVHCGDSSTTPDCTSATACPPGTADGGSGVETGSDAAAFPPTCDLAKSVKDSPDCVDEFVGVFVAASGDDGATGSRSKPVRSISRAAEIAASLSKPRIYVCGGIYTESVEIKQPVSIFGGFSCTGTTWSPSGATVAWKGVNPRFALRIVGVGQRVALEDVDITAADGVTAGESSIGVFVGDSQELALTRVVVTAGRGVDGETLPSKAARPLAGKGGAASNPNGGLGTKNVCADGESAGGNGAMIGDVAASGLPSLGGGAAGQTGISCVAGGAGGVGSDGTAGEPAIATTSLGELSRDGWKPAAGSAGTAGARGQGGGGGGSRQGAGGGGGAGGCGGEGGPGGTGGGASVALVAFSAKVTAVASKLRAGAAGNGASGSLGQQGQPPGGAGDPGVGSPNSGCIGGDGGAGGNGGAGGGGAGGVSAAILHKGPSPVISDSELAKGTAGAKGLGGANTATADGPDGKAAEVLGLP